MGDRRKGRESALQILYQIELTHAEPGDVFDSFWAQRDDSDSSDRSFAEALVGGALERLESIDAIIESASDKWELHRISRIDLSLIRLAVAELLAFDETPGSVVLDEAVSIAQRFSDENAPAFVNGVLDRVARDLGRLETDSED